MSNEWSTEPPKEEGWYWAFVEASKNEIQVVYVYIGLHNASEISVITFGSHAQNPVSIVRLWGERLEKPEAPTHEREYDAKMPRV